MSQKKSTFSILKQPRTEQKKTQKGPKEPPNQFLDDDIKQMDLGGLPSLNKRMASKTQVMDPMIPTPSSLYQNSEHDNPGMAYEMDSIRK